MSGPGALRRGRGRRRRTLSGLTGTGRLRLTSMMDILVVLLLFLLKSFVLDGEPMIPPAGVELPKSTATGTPEASLVVAIFDDVILVGDEPVARVSESLETGGLSIAPLRAHLEGVWARLDRIAELQGETEAPQRTVTVQGDREMEFRILEKVMFTLAESGFEDVALAVVKKPRSDVAASAATGSVDAARATGPGREG